MRLRHFNNRFMHRHVRPRPRLVARILPEGLPLNNILVRRIDSWQETKIVGDVPGHGGVIVVVNAPSSRKFLQCSTRHPKLALGLQIAPDFLAIALTGQKLLVGAQDDHCLVGVFFEQLDPEAAQAKIT